MQWIQPDRRGPMGGSFVTQLDQIAEIADTPVVARAQRVQLDRNAPKPRARSDRRRFETDRRRDDQQAAIRRALSLRRR